MNKVITLFGLAGVALLAGCAGLSADQIDQVKNAIDPLVGNGTLTSDQADVLLSALTPGFDWASAGEWAGVTMVNLVLGYFGIRSWRGTPNNRKGAL